MHRRIALPLLLLAASPLRAQERFVTQTLVVPTFAGADRRMASRASDIIRDRVDAAFPESELRVISRGDVDRWLRLSGFDTRTQLSETELHELATKFRADERITGRVARHDGRVHIDARLSLIRDIPALTQPISAEGAALDAAAAAVAAEIVAARGQLVPLRECENDIRSGAFARAASAAREGVIAYRAAVPARVCLLRAMREVDAPADSIASVARAALAHAPENPVALASLADALEALGDRARAADAAVRLLSTDSTNESLIESVVTTLSRLGYPQRAQPIVDRGSDRDPDNLPLLKLRWLVHLAAQDWTGAIAAGERLRRKDKAANANPEFFSRLAQAYRADAQPTRALAVAAEGVAAFPGDAGLELVYLELLRAETEVALPRALARNPQSPELHALAARQYRSAGRLDSAIVETRRAAMSQPSLPHAWLQLAQLEMNAGHPDSAYAALESALRSGEDVHTVARFALARGDSAYRAATASRQRDDFQRAVELLALAARLDPTPAARFLLGAASLSVGQSAASEANTGKSCELSQLADSSLRDAESNLGEGESIAPDAAKQYLEYAARLRPYVAQELKTFCAPADSVQRVRPRLE